jgi:hypothetical protein
VLRTDGRFTPGVDLANVPELADLRKVRRSWEAAIGSTSRAVLTVPPSALYQALVRRTPC